MGAQSVGRVKRGRMGAPRDPGRMAGCGMGGECMGGQQDECWGVLGDTGGAGWGMNGRYTEGCRVGDGGCRRTHGWVLGDEWGDRGGCWMGAGGCRRAQRGAERMHSAWGKTGDAGWGMNGGHTEGCRLAAGGCKFLVCVGRYEGPSERRGEGRHSRDLGVQEGCRGIGGCRRDAGWRG